MVAASFNWSVYIALFGLDGATDKKMNLALLLWTNVSERAKFGRPYARNYDVNMLKARIEDGRATRALWLAAGSPVMAEAAVYAGMRFLLIDNEHGPASVETTAHMARAIEAAGGHPMVRVGANDVLLLKQMLDIGIKTLMVPMVNTVDEAHAAVAACHYPPQGERGFAGGIRASQYGNDERSAQKANDDIFIMVQLESPTAVENAAEIAEVDGVDMLFIGPYDMSGGYGKLGDTGCDEVEASIAHISKISSASGKPLGTVPRAGKSASELLNNGYGLVVSDSEVDYAMAAISAEIKAGDAEWF